LFEDARSGDADDGGHSSVHRFRPRSDFED
jgi:hypothetical protein